jgi:predicted NAD-dependent protein-ADP-ribosyltransferase YbiA (DUF1768 family)
MSEATHFTHAPEELKKEFLVQLNATAEAMGRTNSREDRVDWSAVNQKMAEWWHEQGYLFP